MFQKLRPIGRVIRKSAAGTVGTYSIPFSRVSDHVTSAGETGKPANVPGTGSGGMSCAAATRDSVPQSVVDWIGTSELTGRAKIASTRGLVRSEYGAMPPRASGFHTLRPRISVKWT